MAKETLGDLIEKTSTKFQDNKNRVAFLGEVSSGKTVVAALLNYTLSKLWIPKTNGKWEVVPISGQDEINDIVRKMKKGEFPPATLGENYPKLVVGIYNMEGTPTKYELILHDMSGENYSEYLTDPDYQNIEERLMEILSNDSAYLAYAKKYVIMIDCEKREDWDTDISKVAAMISRIREIKQKIHNFEKNEKLHVHIAILFTKADLLSEDDQAKMTRELAKEYPSLISSLNVNLDKEHLEFFKMSVSTSIETNEEAKARFTRREEEIKKEQEERLKKWNMQIKIAVNGAVTAAKTEAERERRYSEEITKIMENVRLETQEKYKRQFDEKHPILKNKEKIEPKSKINVPFTYSELEYSKFISWILNVTNDS